MRRIQRLPVRALLRHSKPTSQQCRTQCTSFTSSKDPRTARQLMEDPDNEHLRDEYVNTDGEVVFKYKPNTTLTDDDWRQFEAAFGLDQPIPPEKVREWEAMISEDEKPFMEDMPRGAGHVTVSLADQEDEKPKRAEKVVEKVVKRHSPVKDPVEDRLRQPLHRRPGYEKRVASMEAEMTRLVSDVLVERGSDWYKSGADIERVLLSPNLRNLTIYYTVDDEQPQSMERKDWRRLNKAMAARIHKKIFETMDVRYAPTVFFKFVDEDDKSSRKSALEEAFAQIEAERLERSTKQV